jgi:hypothetical protein
VGAFFGMSEGIADFVDCIFGEFLRAQSPTGLVGSRRWRFDGQADLDQASDGFGTRDRLALLRYPPVDWIYLGWWKTHQHWDGIHKRAPNALLSDIRNRGFRHLYLISERKAEQKRSALTPTFWRRNPWPRLIAYSTPRNVASEFPATVNAPLSKRLRRLSRRYEP